KGGGMGRGRGADGLVRAGTPGTYELNAIHSSHLPLAILAGGPGTYEPSPTGPLARVVVAGEPLPMKLPAALPKPPLETIRDSEITGRRAVVLSTIGDPPE